MVDSRLKTVYDEASKLFISKGYARTQINYIANAASISVGAIYTLFTSKKAILNFVLKCTVDSEYMEYDLVLPIKESNFVELEDEIIEVFEKSNLNFRKHLNDENNSYSFEEMISDTFDIITKYGVGFLILQNNSSDCGELYESYMKYRRSFCEYIKEYVYMFIKKGEIRKLEYPDQHIRLIIEILSWWGMHAKYDDYVEYDIHAKSDCFETNIEISEEMSKKVVIDSLLHAYAL